MSGSVGGEECDVNMTPLLDLVLQLIMFFMITVNFVRAEQLDESVKLPMSMQSTPLTADASHYFFLNLNSKGEFVGNLEGQEVNTPGKLMILLQTARKDFEAEHSRKFPDTPVKVVVVLRADQNVRYGKIWEVLDTCKRAGMANWQIRVITPAGAGKAARPQDGQAKE